MSTVMQAPAPTLTITKVKEHIGAIVTGIDRITQPQFCYAHEYQKGDLLIIDDRQSLHKAGFDYDHSQRRLLYRMLVRGDRPY
jgi:hypothetical protein